MPSVFITGKISNISLDFSVYEPISLSYSLVLGSKLWYLKRGNICDESYTISGFQGEDANSVGKPVSIDCPIDIHLETQSTEGWPVFTFELWSRPTQQMHELLGCGMIWCPTVSGSYDVRLWKPRNPVDLTTLRAYLVRPFTRNQLEADTVGELKLDVFITLSSFEDVGVSVGKI